MAGSPTIMWVNGWDPGDAAGLIIESVEGWLDSPTLTLKTSVLPGTAGGLLLDSYSQSNPRVITVKGYVEGTSAADVRTHIAAIRNMTNTGMVALSFNDNQDKEVWAVCTDFKVTNVHPQWVGTYLGVQMTFTCLNPYILAKTPTIVPFSTVLGPCPLGSAPSFPVIRIAGAVTNPVITLRPLNGAARTMGFTVALGATEYLEIDSWNKSVIKYTAGSAANAISTWTSGFFHVLSPDDSDRSTNWPTLEVSPAADCHALYRKTYL